SVSVLEGIKMRVLAGLRADNLLGYLAALGVCRLTECGLSWAMDSPVEFAALDTELSVDDLVELLAARCSLPPIVAHCSHRNLILKIDEWAGIPDEWAAAIACQTVAGFDRSPLLTCGSAGRQVTTVIDKLCKAVDMEDIRT